MGANAKVAQRKGMEANDNMKAQLSIEFLIIFVIMLLLFTNVSMDLIDASLGDASEMQFREVIRAENSTLYAASAELTVQAVGAKRPVFLRAPPDCKLTVGPTAIVTSGCANASYNNVLVGPMLTKTKYVCSPCTITSKATLPVVVERIA